jgi:hypothetical protein
LHLVCAEEALAGKQHSWSGIFNPGYTHFPSTFLFSQGGLLHVPMQQLAAGKDLFPLDPVKQNMDLNILVSL